MDPELYNRLGAIENFSAYVNAALEEKINEYRWIPNVDIHKHAGLSAKTFLERIQYVEYLRVRDNDLKFTFYPTDKGELEENKRLYAYANSEYNKVHNQYIYFNLEFPTSFYLFLRTNPWNNVSKAIQGFLAAYYFLKPDKRELMTRQLEPTILKKALSIYESKFSPLETKFHLFLNEDSYDEIDEEKYHNERRAFCIKYQQVLTEINLVPLVYPYITQVLQHDYPFNIFEMMSFSKSFDISINAAYMRDVYQEKDDWQTIVINENESKGTLEREESQKAPFQSWKEYFKRFNYTE